MNSSQFWKYYWMTFYKPGEAFTGILQDSKSVGPAVRAVLISALLYTAVYIFLIFGGGQPFKPWLDISLELYYRYNVFFCLPSMFLGWILSAGVIQILAKLYGGQGNFEQVLLLFGFSIGVASWSTGLHDLISSFLGAVGIIDQSDYERTLNSPTLWRLLLWIQMVVYLLWFTFLFAKAISISHNLGRRLSLLLGFLGFLVYQLFFLIFNR
jgi:hypothetical protein